MITYESQTIVHKPVDQVFRAATDVNLYSKWTDMSDTHLVTGNDIGSGAQLETMLHMGFMNLRMTFEISEYVKNQVVGYKTISEGPMVWNARYDFTPLEDGSTQLHQKGDISLKGLWKLIEPLMSGEVQKGEAAELEKLRDYVEKNS